MESSVGSSIRSNVGSSIGNSIECSTGNSIWNNIGISIGSSVGNSIGSSIESNIGSSVDFTAEFRGKSLVFNKVNIPLHYFNHTNENILNGYHNYIYKTLKIINLNSQLK